MDKLSRRTFIKGSGVAAGVAGVAASTTLLPAVLGGAEADASPKPAKAARTAKIKEPVVAHVRNARTGEISLFVGTREIKLRDRELTQQLLRAAD